MQSQKYFQSSAARYFWEKYTPETALRVKTELDIRSKYNSCTGRRDPLKTQNNHRLQILTRLKRRNKIRFGKFIPGKKFGLPKVVMISGLVESSPVTVADIKSGCQVSSESRNAIYSPPAAFNPILRVTDGPKAREFLIIRMLDDADFGI